MFKFVDKIDKKHQIFKSELTGWLGIMIFTTYALVQLLQAIQKGTVQGHLRTR